MTFSDLIHAVLVFAGLCVGLAVGVHHGAIGAVLGAGAGFLVGHLVGIVLVAGDLLGHGIANWWRRR